MNDLFCGVCTVLCRDSLRVLRFPSIKTHQGVAGYRGPGLHHKMTFITRKQSTTKGIKSLKMTNPATDRDDLLQNLIGNFFPLWPAVLFIHLDYLL